MNTRFGLLNELRLRYVGVFVFMILLSGLMLWYRNHQERRIRRLAVAMDQAQGWDEQVQKLVIGLAGESGAALDTAPLVQLSQSLSDARKDLEDYRGVEKRRAALGLLVFVGSCLGVWISLSIPQLEELVEEVRSSATKVASSTRAITRVSDEHAAQSAQQSSAVQELAATSEEIAASARSIRENAGTMKRVMDAALLACTTGRKQLERITTEMSAVQTQVEEIGEGMKGLSGVADRIRSITEIIDEISDQTNLLALNAAIEAAGAGEAGKRFAVVATEVRRLSERTAEATGEIAGLVAEVRRRVQETSNLTRQGTEAVERGAREIEDAGGEFQTIFETVEETGHQVQEITHATEQQEQATGLMAGTVSEVQGLVGGVHEGAERARHAAGDLGDLADRLLELVGEAEDAAPEAPRAG